MSTLVIISGPLRVFNRWYLSKSDDPYVALEDAVISTGSGFIRARIATPQERELFEEKWSYHRECNMKEWLALNG